MKMNLQLSLHHMKDNEGLLIFKNLSQRVRISKLTNALQFMANMKQLSMAIDADGKQDCCYELKNWAGLQWVLNCTFKKGIVGLELWFQKFGFNDHLDTLFSWHGKGSEFRDSINFMIEKAGRYKFFAKS